MTDFHIRPDCRLCSGPIRTVLDLGSTPLANELPAAPIEGGQDKFPLYLAQCESCGHVQLPVVVDPKRLFPPDYPYQSGTSPVFRAHLKEFAATVSGMIPKGGRVLEIASNDGSLLNEFRALGHDPWGVDPATPRDRRTFSKFFDRAFARTVADGSAFESGVGMNYNTIVALNVFAHVDDLNDFTAGVAELLAPDGVFVFEVGYFRDVVEKGLVGCVYHEHLSYHTIRPLDAFFARHGLCLDDAHRVDSQGGSIRCFVRRRENVSGSSTAWHRLVSLAEQESGLDVSRLARRIAANDTLSRVMHLKAHGKRVAAFGAPAKLTTWAYALGLGPEDVCWVADDNPLKVGRYTPGNFWPIVPSGKLLEDQPDAIVLFSSNFEAEIRERFKDYKGEWIVV